MAKTAHSLAEPADLQRKRQSTQFNFRIDVGVRERVERAASLSHLSLTDFTAKALSQYADEVLARHEQIVLSDRDYDLFVQIMTGDSEPTEIALKEAAEFRQGNTEGARYRW